MAGSIFVRYILFGALILLTGTLPRADATTSAYLYSAGSLSASTSSHSLSSPSSPTVLRILPLGDSVTFAYNDPTGNGYRYFLECMLSRKGHAVQYTGSHLHGNWPNSANHGLTLHTVALINDNVTGEWAKGAAGPGASEILQPNVVLTHVGTVDLIKGDPDVQTQTAAGLAATIDLTARLWPDALQVVAQLVTHLDGPTAERIRAFNAQVPDVVRRKAWEGRKVLLASMIDVDQKELIDGVHPNGTGYMKMAERWYELIADAEFRGMIPQLSKAMQAEVLEQQVKDRESMARCDKVFADLKEGIVEKGDVVDD